MGRSGIAPSNNTPQAGTKNLSLGGTRWVKFIIRERF